MTKLFEDQPPKTSPESFKKALPRKESDEIRILSQLLREAEQTRQLWESHHAILASRLQESLDNARVMMNLEKESNFHLIIEDGQYYFASISPARSSENSTRIQESKDE